MSLDPTFDDLYDVTLEHLETQQLRLIGYLINNPTDYCVAQVLADFTEELATLKRWES